MNQPFPMRPVATLRTCFAEKFGIPRQSGMVEEAEGVVEFLPEFSSADFVRGLEGVSHIWLVTVFHQSAPWDGKATVRPPRLGGNERLGVFATRSPNRPNPIALSLVRLLAIETTPRLTLRVAGVDAVDGTPVLDVKPYLPWCESRPEASAGWAGAAPSQRDEMDVIIPPELSENVLAHEDGQRILRLIIHLLRFEPQPAYIEDNARTYGMCIAGWNVRWRNEEGRVIVTESCRIT